MSAFNCLECLYKKGKIGRWENAIPIGNGTLGGLIYSEKPLIFSIDSNKTWDMRMANQKLGFDYSMIKEAVKNHDENLIKEIDKLSGRFLAYPTKLPGFRILIDEQSEILEYRLNLRTGVATIYFKNGQIIETFISRKNNLGYIICDRPCDVKLQMPDYETKKDLNSQQSFILSDLGYKNGTRKYENNILTVLQTTTTSFAYSCGFTTKKLYNKFLIIYGLETSDNGDADLILRKKIGEAIDDGVESIKKLHIKQSKRYRNKSYIYIKEEQNLSNLWTLNDYYFGCCSTKGGNPIALQGVWTADNGELPPWRGDYHFDMNIQMTYWAYMKANHLDNGRSLVDFLWKTKDKAKLFAKEFFNGKGIALPGCVDVNLTSISGWHQYNYSLTAVCWASQAFEHYYQYTKSITFLRTRAYPYFKGVAEFILSTCEKVGEKIILPLTSSPEIFGNRWEAWLPNNSAYDISLIRYVFEKLIEYSKILKKPTKKWELAISKVESIPVGKDGVIELCRDVPLNESHRHLSHLIGIYPLNVLKTNNKNEKEIAVNSAKAFMKLGTSAWMGYTFGWYAGMCVRLGMYSEAEYCLKAFEEAFVAENGFHLNGDFKNKGYTDARYMPFTLEGNFAYNDALQEMLLRKDDDGNVLILKGIPKEWKNVRFKLRSERNIYECELKDGELIKLIIKAPENCFINIVSEYLNGKYELKKGENIIKE